jgi:hypothetical protein
MAGRREAALAASSGHRDVAAPTATTSRRPPRGSAPIAVTTDGVGTDGTHAFVSLRAQTVVAGATDELRRYPLARITEWGLPWTAE